MINQKQPKKDHNIFPEFTRCFEFTMEFHEYYTPTPDEYHSYLWSTVVRDELKFFCEVFR